jgi:hypothetical protein
VRIRVKTLANNWWRCLFKVTRKLDRREILESENRVLAKNKKALNFIRENGPDTLINCISINFRTWDKDRYSQHQTMYQNQTI